jgi:hypothetical protein
MVEGIVTQITTDLISLFQHGHPDERQLPATSIKVSV